MTGEVFLTPGSAGPSSAPHGFLTFHGTASSFLKARFAPALHRGGGTVRAGSPHGRRC